VRKIITLTCKIKIIFVLYSAAQELYLSEIAYDIKEPKLSVSQCFSELVKKKIIKRGPRIRAELKQLENYLKIGNSVPL
jgi:hypothetical protein